VTLAADLWTKHWVWTHLRPTGTSRELLGSTLELHFAFNRGTAFSVIREVQHPLVFLPITILVVALTTFIVLRTPGVDRLRMLALGLVSGGALGNLHDRLFRVDDFGNHGVVDFIKFNYPWGGSWPSFNLADTALVIGTILLLISLSRASDSRGSD
jgi:signal peptidase II